MRKIIHKFAGWLYVKTYPRVGDASGLPGPPGR